MNTPHPTLFDAKYDARAEERRVEAEQAAHRSLADEFHNKIREACDVLGRKSIALDLGVDLSTLSNWLSCEQGRGFPPPKLVLYLGARHDPLAQWLAKTWGYLPIEKPHQMTESEELRRLKAALAANPDIERAIREKAFGSSAPLRAVGAP